MGIEDDFIVMDEPDPPDDEDPSDALDRFEKEMNAGWTPERFFDRLKNGIVCEIMTGRKPGLGLVDYRMLDALCEVMETAPDSDLAVEIRRSLAEISEPTVQRALTKYGALLPGGIEIPVSLQKNAYIAALQAFEHCRWDCKLTKVMEMNSQHAQGREKLTDAQRKTARGKKRSTVSTDLANDPSQPVRDLQDAITWIVGEVVIHSGVLPPLAHELPEGAQRPDWKHLPLEIPSEAVLVDEIVKRWHLWRRQGSDGTYRHIGPWPFRPGELEAALCVPDFPREVAGQIFDAAVFEIVPQATIRWVDWCNTAHRQRMVVVAAFSLWASQGRGTLLAQARKSSAGGPGKPGKQLSPSKRFNLLLNVLGRTLVSFDPYRGRDVALESHPLLLEPELRIPDQQVWLEEMHALSEVLRNLIPLLPLRGYIGVDDDLRRRGIKLDSAEATVIRDRLHRPLSLAVSYLEETVIDLLPKTVRENLVRRKRRKYKQRYQELVGTPGIVATLNYM